MDALFVFYLKSIVCSGIFFLYYLLVLRNKKLHTFNRFYLLFIVVASLIIPAIHIEWQTLTTVNVHEHIPLMRAVISAEEEIVAPVSVASMSLGYVPVGIYILITVCLLIMLVLRIAWIFRLKRQTTYERRQGYTFVYTSNSKAPFSFLHYLFWRDDIGIESVTGQQILQHELTHIRQRHSLDKIFIEIITACCWLNPVYWLIKKELSMVHEFIADENAVDTADTESFARMLLQSHYNGAYPQIINPFFFSPIKRRLMMLNKIKSYSYLRRYMILPVLGIAFLLFSFKRETVSPNKASKKIIIVLDAGHGGTDAGITGADGISEKDLTLKIASKMNELAEAYNIQVILTRKGDEYPTLDQRARMVRANAADLLVSVHVNDRQDGINKSGYEVIVGRTSSKKTESIALASAISYQLKSMNIYPTLVEKGVHILNNAGAPAVLIECGYINNPEEMRLLSSDAQLEKLCRNILNGIIAYEGR